MSDLSKNPPPEAPTVTPAASDAVLSDAVLSDAVLSDAVLSDADREWLEANFDAYLADGLSSAERSRVDRLLENSPELRAVGEAARSATRELERLFAPLRPSAELEDQLVSSLQSPVIELPESRRPDLSVTPPSGPSMTYVLTGVVAATIVLGFVGLMAVQSVSPDMAPNIGLSLDRASSRPKSSETKSAAEAPSYAAGGVAADRSSDKPRDGGDLDMLSSREGKLAASPTALPALDPTATGLTADSFGPERRLDSRMEAEQELARSRNADPGRGIDLRAGLMPEKSTGATPTATRPPPPPPAARPSQPFRPGELIVSTEGKDSSGSKPSPDPKAPDSAPPPKAEPPAEPAKADPAKPDPTKAPPAAKRMIIRNGEMEFEVDSFEAAVATVTKIVGEEDGFVGTVNSDKLPNGKIRGTVIVRCPPERLDTLVLKLRALGELKNQNLRAQDVTEQFVDMDSRMRALKVMEDRLLKHIQDGKIGIKELLDAEKRLGEIRSQIESLEGQLRVLANLVSLSTLRITLYEKELRKPASAVESERVDLGLETEDVEKNYREALDLIGKAKGRVFDSRLDKLPAGQFAATIRAEAPADEAGPLLDKLRLLGKVARLNVNRNQRTDGTGLPTPEVKVRKTETTFQISMFNLANVEPRETVLLTMAVADPDKTYNAILEMVRKSDGGRILSSQLDGQKNDQGSARLQFHIRTAAAEADRLAETVKGLGEVLKTSLSINPDNENVTAAKKGFDVTLLGFGRLTPRRTETIRLNCKDVADAHGKLEAAIKKISARVIASQLNENNRRNVTATLDFEFRKENEAEVTAALRGVGEVLSHDATRNEGDNAVDGKIRMSLTLIPQAAVPPRETVVMSVEVEDGSADKTLAALSAAVAEGKGKIVESSADIRRGTQATVRAVYELPLSVAGGLIEKCKAAGTVRENRSNRRQDVPEGELSVVRVELTLVEAAPIIDKDDGFGSQLKSGLTVCVRILGYSVFFVAAGLGAILPIGLVLWVIVLVGRRMSN